MAAFTLLNRIISPLGMWLMLFLLLSESSLIGRIAAFVATLLQRKQSLPLHPPFTHSVSAHGCREVGKGTRRGVDILVGVMRLRIDLAYDGGGFFGWAKQPTIRTVQGEIERVLHTITRVPVDDPPSRCA